MNRSPDIKKEIHRKRQKIAELEQRLHTMEEENTDRRKWREKHSKLIRSAHVVMVISIGGGLAVVLFLAFFPLGNRWHRLDEIVSLSLRIWALLLIAAFFLTGFIKKIHPKLRDSDSQSICRNLQEQLTREKANLFELESCHAVSLLPEPYKKADGRIATQLVRILKLF